MQIKIKSTRTLIFLLVFFHFFQVMGKENSKKDEQTENSDSWGLEYPELLVSPLASERIKLEYRKERLYQWTRMLNVQVPALATLIAAGRSQPRNDRAKTISDQNTAVEAAQVLGASWIVGTVALQFLYQPYKSAFREIRTYTGKSKRDELARERLAEEHIEFAGQLGRKIRQISALTNFGVSLALTFNGSRDTEIAGSVSAAVALASLMFPNQWELVNEKHSLYKKRIYGPLVGMTTVQHAGQSEAVPLFGFGMSY